MSDVSSYSVVNDNGVEGLVIVIITPFSEYAKLITHSNQVLACIQMPVIISTKGTHIAALVLKDAYTIADFIQAIDKMKPWVDKDAKSVNSQLLLANDTIKELRSELKTFRVQAKKKKKFEQQPPPAYIAPDLH